MRVSTDFFVRSSSRDCWHDLPVTVQIRRSRLVAPPSALRLRLPGRIPRRPRRRPKERNPLRRPDIPHSPLRRLRCSCCRRSRRRWCSPKRRTQTQLQRRLVPRRARRSTGAVEEYRWWGDEWTAVHGRCGRCVSDASAVCVCFFWCLSRWPHWHWWKYWCRGDGRHRWDWKHGADGG